jgi:carboxypeptidase family protein
MHRPRWFTVVCTAALFLPAAVAPARTHTPATQPPSASGSQAPEPSSGKPAQKKHSHADDFLIRGTVFNEKALSFPGVHLRIRRAGEKKFHWESYTNSRGEFAVRVPQGSDYEMVVSAKGYEDQVRALNAKSGDNEERTVLRMQPVAGGKK